MRRRFTWLVAAGLGSGCGLPAALAQAEFGGLPAGPGREEVYQVCNACHSVRLVIQQRLSRERWDELLVWMVEEQGMPAFAPAERERVLDYLARQLGQDVPR